MNTATQKIFSLVNAFAVALLLSACGGGDPNPPPDTEPPTVAITDNAPGATASGPVTFTFTFSEDIDSSFVAEDVAVTGGTAGTLTMVSASEYTMEVAPPADTTGTITVTVAAGKFKDLAGNENVEEASASRAFDTTAPPPVGGTVLVSWDEDPPVATGIGAFGDASPSVEAAPAGGDGNALKLDRSGASNFGGTYFTVPAVPFAADRKTITARVYATRAGAVVYLKVEVPGGASTEVPATVTAANTWQTLTWVLSGVDPAGSYTTMVISADTDVVSLGAQTYWVDDITLLAASGGGGGEVQTFSTGFAAGNLTAEGGEFGGFSGSDQDGYNCSGDPASCGGGGAFTPDVAAADSYFYYYYQTATPATNLYAGIYVQPPGVTGGLSGTADTPGVQIAGQTVMKFNFNPNPEWFGSATPNFMVQLDMGKLYLVGGSQVCHIQLRKVVTPTSADSASYSLPLSSFVVVQNCADPSVTTASALAGSPVSQISFQAAGGPDTAVSDGTKTTGANLSVPNGDGVYPTTLVLKGGITFE